MKPSEFAQLARTYPDVTLTLDGEKARVIFRSSQKASVYIGRWASGLRSGRNKPVDCMVIRGVPYMVHADLLLDDTGRWVIDPGGDFGTQSFEIDRVDSFTEPPRSARETILDFVLRVGERALQAHPDALREAEEVAIASAQGASLQKIYQLQKALVRTQQQIDDILDGLPPELVASLDLSLDGIEA